MTKEDKIDISTISGGIELAQSNGRLKSNLCGTNAAQEKISEKAKAIEESDGHHSVSHPTSYTETLLHLFRGNIGSGVLAMGDAFKNGGIVFALIVTALLGIICVHAQHILLNCSDEIQTAMRRPKPPGFADTVALTFAAGPKRLRPLAGAMRALVNTLLFVTQLGFCCVYIVFIAENIKMICDQYNYDISLAMHMAIVIVPILFSCMIRNLKYLTPLSTVANVLMLIGVGAVMWQAVADLPPVYTRTYVGSWQTLPLFFGTAIYAFEGIGLVLPLKNDMRRPELFQKPLGVLNVGMVIVGSIFLTVGSLGYMKWGDDVKGSLTLNLDPEDIISNVVRAFIALAILLTYPLQFYVPVCISWPSLRRRCGTKWLVPKEIGYRIILIIITFVLAQTIPKLGLIISLVGAVSSSSLALVFPPLIELLWAAQSARGLTMPVLIKDSFIILLGFFIFSTGTYESVASIARAF